MDARVVLRRYGQLVQAWWGRRTDVAVAVALTAAAEGQFWGTPPADLRVAGGRVLVAILFAVCTGVLVWRRSHPIPVTGVSFVACLTGVLLVTHYPNGGPLAPFLAVIVAFYSLGAYGETAPAVPAAVLLLTVVAALDIARSAFRVHDGVQPAASLVFGLAWVVGSEVRRRRREVVLLRERAARLEQEREDKAREAVAEERTRIARELHDVVAHSVSVMVVQSQAGPRLLGDRDAAAGAFRSIEGAGRQALVELRRLLGVLRTNDEQPAIVPQPGLDSLPALCEQVRASGVPVTVSQEGEPVPLPAGIDLSAYRIVQEALTNVIKHAGKARAEVVIRYANSGIEILVCDDGPGPNGAAHGSGHGLIGMRERVGLYGGHLQMGARNGAGYEVRAWLPINGTPL